MKKIFLATVLGTSLMAVSCSGVRNASAAQSNRAEFLKMKGTWRMSSIDYDKSFRIKPFDENADASCFVGSMWTLVPNNYTGTYMLNGSGSCPTVTQPIKFEVTDGNTFMFKKIAGGTKAKQNTMGYALTLVSQTADMLSLEQNVPFEGQTVRVVYNFQRTGK